jgi:hypothetical protein
MPSLIVAVLATLAVLLPTSAWAGSCRVLGEPDTSVSLYGKPAGPQTGSVKAGTVMTAMGGGHDTSGRTWTLVGQGPLRGWIELSKLACNTF